MDIREKIIRKTAIYFKENTLDDLCLFMENILDFQKNCLKENLKTLRKAEEDIKSNFRIYLNEEKFMENIYLGLYFQLIFVLGKIVNEELKKSLG